MIYLCFLDQYYTILLTMFYSSFQYLVSQVLFCYSFQNFLCYFQAFTLLGKLENQLLTLKIPLGI